MMMRAKGVERSMDVDWDILSENLYKAGCMLLPFINSPGNSSKPPGEKEMNKMDFFMVSNVSRILITSMAVGLKILALRVEALALALRVEALALALRFCPWLHH